MNTKITKTLIRKVLRMRKVQWHDRQWHNFMSQAEVEAVEYGIMEVRGAQGRIDLDDIKEEAERYLTAQA